MSSKPVYTEEELEKEERQGLLTGEESLKQSLDDAPRGWSRKTLIITSSLLILLLLGATLLPRSIPFRAKLKDDTDSESQSNEGKNLADSSLQSNGTHYFKPTVLMVSIDGLRADYLDRGLTPHLLEISRTGLRAKWMKPAFPTLTFPNHWTLLTGLYAESHGIVANNFYDPGSQRTFSYSNPKMSWDASWWNGEPIWETAEKAGLKTANLMWPGPPTTRNGISPTYFVPFKNKVAMSEKLDQLMAWIDLPIEKRPQLIIAYEPSLDQAGHKYGPVSKQVNDSLAYVDRFARDLHSSLASRNLSDIVDIIFVSDHGMTGTSHVEYIYMEEILGEYMDAIEHEDGWPSMGLRFKEGTNTSHALELLKEAESKNPEKFSVFTKEGMPSSYHFQNSPRIAPIYCIPKVGYALTTSKEGNTRKLKGIHGYDNTHPSMYSMFVSDGPFSNQIKQEQQLKARSLKGLVARVLGGDGRFEATGETFVIKPFQNVEIYGLVVKLLGIGRFAAQTNGTAGFWDKYL